MQCSRAAAESQYNIEEDTVQSREQRAAAAAAVQQRWLQQTAERKKRNWDRQVNSNPREYF
jgi:hypothetical protein